MAYPTPTDIDNAIPVDGEPSRALTNEAIKAISSESTAAATKLDTIEEGATANSSDAELRDRATHTGIQYAESIVDLPDLLVDKVDAVEGRGLSEVNFSQELSDKLAGLDGNHIKGAFVSIEGLETAHPTAEAGDYAIVDEGAAGVNWFAWNDEDGVWTRQEGESTQLTPAQAKSLYEQNLDTNAFTDDEKTLLASFQNRHAWSDKGTWNAVTNTPTLLDGNGRSGDFYVVTTPGERSFGSRLYNFELYDWIVFFRGTWIRFATNPKPLIWENISDKPEIPSSGSGVPIGTVLTWLAPVLPTGFIWLDEYTAGTYPELDALFPSGVPDIANRVFRHVGDLTGAVGSTQEDAMQQITGYIDNVWTGGPARQGGAFARNTANTSARPSTGTQANARFDFDSANSPGARTATETRVKSVIFRAIIKAYN